MRRLAHSELVEFTPSCGGPHFEAGLFLTFDRLSRFCGGGGKGGDGGAAAAAEASRAQAQAQHEDNTRQLRKQARTAANAKSPEFTPASAPTAASQEVADAGYSERKKQQRRFGFGKTVSAETLGTSSTLGAAA